MKLAITQVVLGIIIIMASLWVTGWMIYQSPHELAQRTLDGGYYFDVVPEHNTLFIIARYGSYALPVLGILLVISGTVRAASKTNKRFWPPLNIAIGILVASLAFVIATWGYPTTFFNAAPGGDTLLLRSFGNPGYDEIRAQWMSAALLLPALAALGVGIAQLVKLKKTQSI
jgi:hypothetical protein